MQKLICMYHRTNGYNGDTCTCVVYWDSKTGRILASYDRGEYSLISYEFSVPTFQEAVDTVMKYINDHPSHFFDVTMLNQ
jgi:hypothetical protein